MASSDTILLDPDVWHLVPLEGASVQIAALTGDCVVSSSLEINSAKCLVAKGQVVTFQPFGDLYIATYKNDVVITTRAIPHGPRAYDITLRTRGVSRVAKVPTVSVWGPQIAIDVASSFLVSPIAYYFSDSVIGVQSEVLAFGGRFNLGTVDMQTVSSVSVSAKYLAPADAVIDSASVLSQTTEALFPVSTDIQSFTDVFQVIDDGTT